MMSFTGVLFGVGGIVGLAVIAHAIWAMRRAAAALPGFAPSLASQSPPSRAAAAIAEAR